MKENSPQDGTAKNVGWLIWSSAVSVANSVLIWIFLARWRSAEEFAALTVALGLYGMFFNISSLGLSSYLVGEISRRRAANESDAATNLIGNALIFLFSTGATCAVVMAASVFLISDSFEVRAATVILSLALVPTGVITLAEAASVATGRARLIALVTTLENALRTVVPLALILLDSPLWAICLAFAAVRIAALIVYWRAGRIFAPPTFVRSEFVALLKIAPTFAGTIIVAAINWQIPVILLARFGAEIETARFGAAARFLIPAAIFTASLANAIQPALMRRRIESRRAAATYLFQIIGGVAIVSGAAAMLSPFLSSFVLSLLFGAKYADANRILDVLAIAVVPFAIAVVAGRGLIAENAQRVDLIANIVGALTALATGLWLIPRSGATGAAAAQMLSFVMIAAIVVGFLTLRRSNLVGEDLDAMR